MDDLILKQQLEKIVQNGISMAHEKGYQWLKTRFQPLLNLAELRLSNELELIADCWYMMGDLHDFNTAPLKAIHCYETAIANDEYIDGAYREIAYQYKLIGQYEQAKEWIIQAIELNPEEEELQDLLKAIEDDINYRSTAYLNSENKIWHYRELLAEEAFDKIIDQIDENVQEDESILQCKAMAYGAKEAPEDYLRCWKRIEKIGQHIIIDYPDWYYMPDSIKKDERIWKIFIQISGRIQRFEMIQDGWIELYSEKESESRLFEEYCRYNLAIIQKDDHLQKIFEEKYPAFLE